MSTIPTVQIQTGPDTYIIVNEADYESFKYMEYTEPKEAAPIQKTKDPVDRPSEPIVTIKKKSVEEVI